MTGPVNSTTHIERLLRDLTPQVLGALARRHDDFAAAEDAVQEALIAAAAQWPKEGVPANPRGWLYHVAMRRLTDHVRSEMSRRKREEAVAIEIASSVETVVPTLFGEIGDEEDDTLTLLFMCCHPALTPPTAIALTLRAVGGLTTAEIAKAFLMPEATMAQRISRAKQSIKSSKVGFAMPTDAERVARLSAVLHVLYLIFNEGYASSSGDELHRTDLSNEAIRLTRMVRARLPNDGEVAGLLALMLLSDARRAARTGAGGELIPLDEQDRTRWNRALIDDGIALASQPSEGLKQLAVIDEDSRIKGHYRLDAVRGHLLERAGDRAGAIASFRAAADGTASVPERNYLLMKISKLSSRAL